MQILQPIINKFIKYILLGLNPEYLALCIENNMYIIQTILWAKKQEAINIKIVLDNYSLTEEQRAKLLADFKKLEMMWGTINLIRASLSKYNLDKVLTVEKLEELMREHHPAMYEVYLSYEERGRRWLENEIEYDLKPFCRGSQLD
jgi:hypothetical protein